MSQSSDSQPVGEAIALEDRSPPQPDGPDGPNSDPTISEAELDASMRTVLRFLRRRMRNARINAFIQEFEQQISSISSNLPVSPPSFPSVHLSSSWSICFSTSCPIFGHCRPRMHFSTPKLKRLGGLRIRRGSWKCVPMRRSEPPLPANLPG